MFALYASALVASLSRNYTAPTIHHVENAEKVADSGKTNVFFFISNTQRCYLHALTQIISFPEYNWANQQLNEIELDQIITVFSYSN